KEPSMLPAAHALIAELDAETPITRRVLERVPTDRLDWQPHPKSLSAGQLAHHIAAIPAIMVRLAQQDGVDMATRRMEYAACESTAAAPPNLGASVAAAREFLQGLGAERAQALWRLTVGEREIFTIPRIAVVRTIGLNHWYHHRGEMAVYLRLLGVPVPVIYGKSADENPLAPADA